MRELLQLREENRRLRRMLSELVEFAERPEVAGAPEATMQTARKYLTENPVFVPRAEREREAEMKWDAERQQKRASKKVLV